MSKHALSRAQMKGWYLWMLFAAVAINITSLGIPLKGRLSVMQNQILKLSSLFSVFRLSRMVFLATFIVFEHFPGFGAFMSVSKLSSLSACKLHASFFHKEHLFREHVHFYS